ncbi:MAG: Ig-like domain-containing protein [Polyangiaceae bacterium]
MTGYALAIALVAALACTGCDQGTQLNQATVTGSPIGVVASNVGVDTSLPADGRIEFEFDRYLVPATVNRQSFALHSVGGSYPNPPPLVAYDPVARIVTITPQTELEAGQNYVVDIATPASPTDLNGLRAIDGATIATKFAKLEFPVGAAGGATAQAALPTIDFCNDIFPLLQPCAGPSCHGGTAPGPASGLRLDTPAAITATAVGRVSQEANTGAVAGPAPAGAHFGVDMPIIDPGDGTGAGGNPGNSWLLYKLLLAVPTAASSASVAGCDGGTTAPTDVSSLHLVAWQPTSDADRANTWLARNASPELSDYVIGREMPFPADPSADPSKNTAALTIDDLERISRWIAQPTNGQPLVPATCPCQ